MKTKYTKQNEVDFYYFLLSSIDLTGYNQFRSQIFEKSFAQYPHKFSEIIKKYSIKYPRETSPETYEYYVSSLAIEGIRHNGCIRQLWNEKDEYFKHKIKITICEDE